MLHVNTSEKNPIFMLTGSFTEICADVAYVISKAHMCFKTKDPLAGEMFKTALVHVVTDPCSPLWSCAQSPNEIVICNVREADNGNEK